MFKTLKNAFENLKKYVWVSAHLNFNFWYCKPTSKARQGHKLKFSCPKWAFCHIQISALLLSLLPNTTVGREESPNMWHTYLGQVFIFLKDLRRVIMKTEVRKMIFGHAVIAWIFLLIFYFCKIKSFGHPKVRSGGKTKRYGRRR